MAYNIYVYARPESQIDNITVKILNTSEITTIYNGNGYDNDWYMTTITGVTGAVEICAVPFHGYRFSRFIYRVGSDDADQQEHGSDKFIYEGNSDLYIRAEAVNFIEEFDWDSSNGWASAEQTQKAYNALVNKGKLKDFSYHVWNDMVEKLLEVIVAERYSWESDVATVTNTKMTSIDRAMTAVRFNSFAGNMVGYGLSSWTSVKKGDPIIAQTFLDLVDALNAYIRNNHQ